MKKFLSIAIAVMTMSACTTRENPFLTEWNTPYGIPPFDEIQVDDYIPAIKEGIAQQQKEVDAITSNPDVPTFENTIAPYEESGEILSKVAGVLYNITETDRTDELDSVMEAAIPLMTEHSDNIAFNKKLYERVAAIYNGDQSNLTREQQMVLKRHFESFERSGIGLPEDKQARLREINTEMATKTQKIGNNILTESNVFKAKFGISVSDYPNAMTTTEDRELRKQMFEAYTMRGHNGNEFDNRQLILDVMGLRIEKAQIMGYKNPAEFILEPKMAHDPQTVDEFLDGIMVAAVKKAKEEVYDMQKVMDEDIAAGKLPTGSKIEPWDWWYYAEKVRKQKYDLDEDLIKPYFKLENVVNGIFIAAKTLYGVNMEKLDGVPAYNKDKVTTYKVTDDKGELLGIFTTDYLPRESKRGGAWMNNIRDQKVDAQGNMVRPIIVNVGNLEEYLNVDEVQTVFHEFGHALHGLLTQCHYPTVSGTSVTRDFVEMFSQFNENWAFVPEILDIYAHNWITDEPIPAELVQKIQSALKFNQGFTTGELCAASILDMKWHELSAAELAEFNGPDDIRAFEEKVCKEMGLVDEIIPRYRTTYFNHIFNSGYSAGYYSYLWAEVLAVDAWEKFKADGVFNKETADSFRATFLERGGSEEPMTLFRSWRGADPDPAALMRARGL